MKNRTTLDRSAIQLVLCQHIMELYDEDLEAAFKEATGETLGEGRDDIKEGWYCWSSTHTLEDLIEDSVGLDIWLNHMRDVVRQRLRANAKST